MAAKLKVLGAVAVTTAGTAVPLTASAINAFEVLIQAKIGNTDNVAIGDSTVTMANGTVLRPGESLPIGGRGTRPAGIEQVFLSDIYVNSAVNGEGVQVTYMAERPT